LPRGQPAQNLPHPDSRSESPPATSEPVQQRAPPAAPPASTPPISSATTKTVSHTIKSPQL
jgi:hypothetical protein